MRIGVLTELRNDIANFLYSGADIFLVFLIIVFNLIDVLFEFLNTAVDLQ